MSNDVLARNIAAFLEGQKESEKADPEAMQGEYRCPICGSRVLWARARNRHLHITCTGCGFMIVE